MPHMINGFGTWNWGKHNVHSYLGRCEQCGYYTTLSSYDTRLYVTALFLPIIPLKRARVIAHCPQCNKYRHIKLREWESKKAQAFAQVRQVLAQTPSDSQAVKQAVGIIYAFQDKAMFNEAVPVILGHHRDNAEILTLIASMYEFFGRPRDAEEVLRAALALHDSAETREELARLLTLDMRPDEARPLLAHVTQAAKREQLGGMLLLVEAYQAQGRHKDALEVIFEVQHVFPDTESDKEWTRLRKASEKNVTTSKVAPSRILAVKLTPMKEDRARWVPFVGPIVLVALLVAFVWSALSKAGGHEAYLVSGAEQPYKITLDGTEYTLRPNYPLNTKLSEGVHTITAESLPVPNQTFEIKTSFLTRPFTNRFFVVNPDRVALLQWEETEYTEKPDETAKYDTKIYTNQLLHEFRGINFKFEEFPEQVKTSGSSTTRCRLGFFTLFSGSDPQLALAALQSLLDPDSFTQYVAARVHLNPNEQFYMFALGNLLEPEAFQQEMSAELKKRPVLVDTHRVYQTLFDAKRPDYDLEKEYAELSAAESDNADLTYLFARVAKDAARSEELLQKAISGPNPSAHAYCALAFSRLSRGQFDEALPFAQQALRLMPDNTSFVECFREIQWARRDYDAILSGIKRDKEGVPVSIPDRILEVTLLALKGAPDAQMQQQIEKGVQSLRKYGVKKKEMLENLKKPMAAAIAYSRGDIDTSAKFMQESGEPGAVAQAALMTGDIDRAIGAMDAANADGLSALTLYAAAVSAGKAELAQPYLDKGMEFLRGQGRDGRDVAACLAGERPADADALCQSLIYPDTKRVTLTVLGLRFPQDQAKYFEMARKLNYKVVVPYDMLKRILGDGSPQGVTPVAGGEQTPAEQAPGEQAPDTTAPEAPVPAASASS